MAAALRLDEAAVMRDGDMLGRLLDSFVTAQLRPELALSPLRPRLHHLREREGRREIDMVIELGGSRIAAIEVKASAAPGAQDARHLAWLRDRLADRSMARVVLHTGPRCYRLGERLLAVPIAAIWA